MLVSIITSSFNSALTIEDTIVSVLNQTYSNIEYIIIDGNSKDRTVEIIKKYEKPARLKGITYKWISEPDEGIYHAMNKGIRLANGDIIGIVNSDDWYSLNTIEKVINASMELDNKIIVGNRAKFSKDKVYRKTFYNAKNIHKTVKNKMPVNHPATFVGAKVYKKVGLFNTRYKLSADYDLIYRCCNASVEFIKVDETLTNMRDGGTTSKKKHLFITAREDYLIQRAYNNKNALFNYAKKIFRTFLIIGRDTLRDIFK